MRDQGPMETHFSSLFLLIMVIKRSVSLSSLRCDGLATPLDTAVQWTPIMSGNKSNPTGFFFLNKRLFNLRLHSHFKEVVENVGVRWA